jgi:hypothetical protein
VNVTIFTIVSVILAASILAVAASE